MTIHQHDPRPFHQRMSGTSVKHLHNILRQLRGGSIGFDPNRNVDTATKAACVTYLQTLYSNEAIDAAHAAVIATYPKGTAPSGRRRRSAPNPFTGAPLAPVYPVASVDPVPTIDPPTITLPAVVAPASGNQGDILTGLAALISGIVAQQVAQHMASLQQSMATLAADVAGKVAQAANSGVTIVELVAPNMPAVNVGLQHKQFPKLLKMVSARGRNERGLNVWVYGPAGTGKTTAAENVAEALSLKFHYNGALDTRYELLGFTDAQGRVVRTAFRDAWEHGGVYLFDEIDASNPNALLALNGALANAVCPFPDGMVKRHKDCVVIAGANTTGAGGTIEYVGRMKQDASLTDRFVYLDWPIDESLERALCADKIWVDRVQQVRRNVAARKVKGVMVTPRATLFGESLLVAGLSRDDVEAAVLRKGIPADVWSQIN